MKQYHDLVERILTDGESKGDRTGTGTLSVFGAQLRFNLQEGFPLLTTKKLHWKSIAAELIWFVHGDTNVYLLNKQGVTIWNEWADEYGYLGPIYGKQWREWDSPNGHIDQLGNVIDEIRSNPNSRRLVVSAWNVADVPLMALPPCHLLYQFYVTNGKLSCHMFQRSCDVFLGLPYNIASYALLTHMVAHVTGLEVGELLISITDAHLYSNHLEQAKLLLTREAYPLPRIEITPGITDIDNIAYGDIKLLDYVAHPSIKAPIAV